MQENSGHDAKACHTCGTVNHFSVLEPPPIQCINCGRYIALYNTSKIAHEEHPGLSRRTFNKEIPWVLTWILASDWPQTLIAPFWTQIVDKNFYEKEEIKKETRVGTGSAKGSTLVIGRAKAGDAFSATVRRRGANVY